MPPTPRKPAAKKPSGRGTARTRIGDAVNAKLTDEAIGALVDEALGAVTGLKAVCPECGNEHRVQIPDFTKIVTTITALLEQAEGRPELRQPDDLTVIIERRPYVGAANQK